MSTFCAHFFLWHKKSEKNVFFLCFFVFFVCFLVCQILRRSQSYCKQKNTKKNKKKTLKCPATPFFCVFWHFFDKKCIFQKMKKNVFFFYFFFKKRTVLENRWGFLYVFFLKKRKKNAFFLEKWNFTGMDRQLFFKKG